MQMQGFFIKPTKKPVKIVMKNKIYFYPKEIFSHKCLEKSNLNEQK